MVRQGVRYRAVQEPRFDDNLVSVVALLVPLASVRAGGSPGFVPGLKTPGINSLSKFGKDGRQMIDAVAS